MHMSTMNYRSECMTPRVTITVAAVEKTVPVLANAHDLIECFQTVMQGKFATEFAPWIAESQWSRIASLRGAQS
jgi:L-lactate utilization protein LutB